jgi:hypothetical protein
MCRAFLFSAAITARLCRTWHLVDCAVLQRSVAMDTDSDFVSVGQPLTEGGRMIVWQVSLYRINTGSTMVTDWRDVSMVHSCVMEAAFQTQIDKVTLPAPDLAPEVQATEENGGDWVVDLEQWTQLNTQTKALRRIRRCVITGPR